MTTKNDNYYVSSGAKNGYYTLRHEYDESVFYNAGNGNHGRNLVHRDHYVMKLTRNPETAIAKAKAYLAENGVTAELSVGFELFDINKSSDWTVFRGGKYEGKSVDWVVENDLDYALWAAENMSGKTYDKTVAILKEHPVVAEKIAKTIADNKSKEEEAAAYLEAHKVVEEKSKEMLRPFAEIMEDGRYGFRDSVAQDFKCGCLPSGRGRSIALEILAKEAGRKNSKAYDAEYERVNAVFKEVEELVA